MARWGKHGDETGGFDPVLIATEHLEEVEEMLINPGFFHGRGLISGRREDIGAIRSQLTKVTTTGFQGLRIDTCAHRRYIISVDKYQA